MSVIHVDFEARYRADRDPWRYETSAYERSKYAATLEACGSGPFGHALELGGSIGVFSALLAPRCTRLETLDGAPTAVTAARERLVPFPGAHAALGTIPADVPDGPFDLVVASEVVYYLEPPRFEETLARLADVLALGGRLVAVHWRRPDPERRQSADLVHRTLRSCAWLRPLRICRRGAYLLDVLERR
ncbi:MAG TPA: SAM-dependent methyltransferase [Conexibacter sp.]|jgi:SAM-dependent methyltransferase|nr:SAM-dependent methyltransferase [Conexibacter sp.]